MTPTPLTPEGCTAPDDTIARDTARSVAPELARRFAFLFEFLKRQVWSRSPLVGVFLLPIMRHLSRSERIFARILALLAEGRLRPERPHAPRPKPAAAPAAEPIAPLPAPPAPLIPRIRLPGARAFLLRRFKHDAAIHTQALEQIFAEPAMRAALALSPCLVRRLRPLCRLLGATLPSEFRPPSRAKSKPPRPKAPRPPRRLSRKKRAEILLYRNFNNRPMKLLPPKNRDF